jgi:ATP-binding cassette subfamily C protein
MIWKELIYKYIKNNKTKIILYIVMVFLTFPVESVVLPKLYSKLFDKIRFDYKNLPYFFSNIKKNINNLSSSGIIWIIIFTWCCVVFFYNMKNRYEAEISPEYLSYVRQKIFSKTIENNSTNFEEVRVGEHITRILDVTKNMGDILDSFLTVLFPLCVAILCMTAYFFILQKKIGVIMMVGISLTIIVLFVMGKECINKSARRDKHYLQMSEKMNDSLGNLMNIYLNNETSKEIKRNDEIDEKYKNALKIQMLYTKNLISIMSIISLLTFIIILIITYDSLRNNKITQGYFISVVIILTYYIAYLIKVSNSIPYFFDKLGIVKNSEKFLNNILKDNINGNNKNQIKNGNIEFKNVYFKYPGTEKYILKNFTVNFDKHKKIGIIGPSGSGKSTIMKLLLRMNKIQQGEILIDGINIENIPVEHIRNKVIYINQKTSLFNTTIMENILYGNPGITEKYVLYIIKKYNLQKVYQGLEKNVLEEAGVNGSNLSLGMQKVTILLRGIFKKGKIIIFDEPLAGLDSITRKKIITMIKQECKGKTVLVITHDKEIIPYCDKVINITDIKMNFKNQDKNKK